MNDCSGFLELSPEQGKSEKNLVAQTAKKLVFAGEVMVCRKSLNREFETIPGYHSMC